MKLKFRFIKFLPDDIHHIIAGQPNCFIIPYFFTDCTTRGHTCTNFTINKLTVLYCTIMNYTTRQRKEQGYAVNFAFSAELIWVNPRWHLLWYLIKAGIYWEQFEFSENVRIFFSYGDNLLLSQQCTYEQFSQWDSTPRCFLLWNNFILNAHYLVLFSRLVYSKTVSQRVRHMYAL